MNAIHNMTHTLSQDRTGNKELKTELNRKINFKKMRLTILSFSEKGIHENKVR